MSGAVRTVAGLAVGTLAAIAITAVTYQTRAVVRLEMDGEAPAYSSGLFAGERDDEVTFAWTGSRAVVRLAGLDRHRTWTCAVRIRAARPAQFAAPTATLAVDEATVTESPSGGDFADLNLEVPPADRSGLTLSLTVTPAFTPGGGDSRQLGVQVDRLTCEPDEGWLRPPPRALAAVAIAATVFGLVALVAGIGAAGTGGVTALVGLAVGLLVVTAGGAFGGYPALVQSTVAVGGATAVVLVLAVRRLANSAGVAIALVATSVAFALELLGLSHPAKPLIDAVFQAHRLEWVLSGRYFFTQPLPDGVAFPYAIGLYVAAAPLAQFISDHVLLVRAVALLAHATAGLAVFWLAVRLWRVPWAGLMALVLYHVVPLMFVVIGNANLPNVFAQSVAVVALAASVAASPSASEAWRSGRLGWVTALLSLAFLSHVSTLALLSGTLVVVAGLSALLGGADGRRRAVGLLVATGLALLLSVALYYRHFPEVYARALSRVTAGGAAAPAVAPSPVDRPAVLARPLSLGEKTTAALRQLLTDVGWPILILAALGAWRLSVERVRGPGTLSLVAWLIAWAGVLAFGVLTRVDTAYQRYAAEFLGRANLAGSPAGVLLGVPALIWAWREGGPFWGRLLTVILVGAAVAQGIASWLGWFGAR